MGTARFTESTKDKPACVQKSRATLLIFPSITL